MNFCTVCPSIGSKERSRQALDRLPLVSNFLTNFWIQHFVGIRLALNSVRNAVWHALNEPVCQYLRTRNPRCSTVYVDNYFGASSERITLYQADIQLIVMLWTKEMQNITELQKSKLTRFSSFLIYFNCFIRSHFSVI